MLKISVNGHTLCCLKVVGSGETTTDVYKLIFTLDTHSGYVFWCHTWSSLQVYSGLPCHFQKYTHMFVPTQENTGDFSSSLLPRVNGLLVLDYVATLPRSDSAVG